ncbi:MAG: hypothetical protein RLY15_1425, partial [Bacteroidota bacterium]
MAATFHLLRKQVEKRGRNDLFFLKYAESVAYNFDSISLAKWELPHLATSIKTGIKLNPAFVNL